MGEYTQPLENPGDQPTRRVDPNESETIRRDSGEAAKRSEPRAGASDLLPRQIGQYRIIRLIGRGGMGAVYEAEQAHPKRIVALKVVNPGVASPKLLKRFEYEAEVLGKLQHPGIAQIYEAGTFDAGSGAQPFFAMELIRGEPLTTYVNRRGLSTRERLQLMVKICDAVQHAHQRGIVHRDLKPGNILVVDDAPLPSPNRSGLGEGQGGGDRASRSSVTAQPKVLDFGIARATDADIQQTTLQTDIGQLIGTIPYMSPEQASGRPEELDTRSDVYALGVIAYELLAGRLPYNLQEKMIHEAVRIIREDDPTPLSTINRTLRGDVETIIGKALEKDKTRRYQSASALQADIERYLKDEPIAARPPSQLYQLRKFAKRNRILVGGVAATFIALIAGLIASLILLGQAMEAREAEAKQTQIAKDNAETAKQEATRAQKAEAQEKARADELKLVSDFQAGMLGQIDPTEAGIKLTTDVNARYAAALEKAGIAEGERATRAGEFRQEWVKVNATDAALALIDETILRPAVKSIDEQFADQPVVDAQLRQVLADRYRDMGLYEQSLPLQESALETRQRVLGEEHAETLTSINNMGALLRYMGRLDRSMSHYREALEARRRVLGDQHPDTLGSINNMGGLLTSMGRLEEVMPYYREALEGYRRVLGDEHPDTLASINNMGALLDSMGRLEEAMPYYREALETRRRVSGDEHPDTLTAINNMGAVLESMGRLDEAMPYYREALEGYRRVLGEEHALTLMSINNMGGLLESMGRFDEAMPHYREALAARRRVLGEEHPDTLSSINNMGYLLESMGRLEEAMPYYREALETRRRVLGDEHPNTLTSMNNLAVLLKSMGRLEEALPCQREVLETIRRVLGEEHRYTLSSISNMGDLLRAMGRLDEAMPYYREALEIRRRVLGEEHPDTLGSINQTGFLLQSMGRLEEAMPYYREALETRRRVLSDEHPDTLTAINNMGALLRELGQLEEAELMGAEAVAGGRAALGQRHWLFGVFLRQHAATLAAMQRYAEAEARYIEAHAILEAALGPAHERTTGVIKQLAELYDAWHAAEPGKGYDAKAAQWRAKLAEVQAPPAPEPAGEAEPVPAATPE